MTSQPLPGLEPVPDVSRWPRLSFGYTLIRERGPIASDEIGAEWCAARGKHSADVRCEWDSQAGKQIGQALRKRGLVLFKRGEGWYVPGVRRASEPSSQMGPDDEWDLF